MLRIGLAILFVLSIALGVASFDRSAPVALPPSAVSAAPPPAVLAPALPAAEQGSAVAQLHVLADGLREDRPVVLWKSLPASHQQDVSALLASCAAELDAQLWSQAFESVESLGVVLTDRSELVRGNALAQSLLAMSNEGRSADPWFRLGPLLTELGRSPLADVEKLATLDVATLLEAQGRTLSASLPDLSQATRGSVDELIATRDQVAATRATALQQQEDRALLKLEAPGQPVEDAWFVRREGRWLPEAMDREWPLRVAQTHERCVSLSAEGKLAGWVQTLASSRDALAQLARAESQAEFDAGIGSVAASVGPQLAQMLLDSMLGSTSIPGIQLNIGSMTYSKGPKAEPDAAPAP